VTPPPPGDCESAQTASNTAASNYAIDASTETCNAYKLALQNQITVCGDATGSIQAIIDGLGDCNAVDTNTNEPNSGCNGNNMRDALGQIVQCNYDSTESLAINNVYIEARMSSDEDGDGVHDHFLNILHITDGTATLDVDNNFVSFEDRTYVYSLSIYSLGTIGLETGVYKILFDVGNQAPFLSLVGSNYSRNDCTSNVFDCGDNNSILNGVVTISGSPGNYEFCFDSLLDFDDNCFKGNYTGDFTPIIIN